MKQKMLFSMVLILVFFCSARVFAERNMDFAKPFCEKLGFSDVNSCLKSKEVLALDCQNISKVYEDWSWLKPAYPMVECDRYYNYSKPALTQLGCRSRHPVDLLVAVEENGKGKIVVVDSADKLRELFAPIEDEKEAMSFAAIAAHALGKGTPYPQFEFDMDDVKKFITNPKPSHAEKKKDGWHIWLYDGPVCSCHYGERSEVEYRIGEDGTGLEKLKEKKAWKRRSRICVD